MPSYIDPESGKRVNGRYRKPLQRAPAPPRPPRSAGSYKNEQGQWVTLRRRRPDQPQQPDEPLNAERGIAQEPSQHIYWRNLRKKKTEQEEE